MKALSFWGKTYEGPALQAAPFKPVLHHLIDVAVVALRLQEINQARTAHEAKLLGVQMDRLVKISAFLAGLHDLGKFAK